MAAWVADVLKIYQSYGVNYILQNVVKSQLPGPVNMNLLGNRVFIEKMIKWRGGH